MPRPTLLRIHQIAGGNPFYGVELAREIDPAAGFESLQLPSSLADLVDSRIARIGPEARGVLLATASVPDPTLRLLAQATDSTAERVLEVLSEAETQGVVVIDGNRVSFTHPAFGSRRLQRSRRRSGDAPCTGSSPNWSPNPNCGHGTWRCRTPPVNPKPSSALDAAAEIAHARGAPAAAAELLDLAINLGAADPARRILCATHHFAAGGSGRARQMLEDVVANLPVGLDSRRSRSISSLWSGSTKTDSATRQSFWRAACRTAAPTTLLRVRMLIMLSYALFNAAQPDRRSTACSRR